METLKLSAPEMAAKRYSQCQVIKILPFKVLVMAIRIVYSISTCYLNQRNSIVAYIAQGLLRVSKYSPKGFHLFHIHFIEAIPQITNMEGLSSLYQSPVCLYFSFWITCNDGNCYRVESPMSGKRLTSIQYPSGSRMKAIFFIFPSVIRFFQLTPFSSNLWHLDRFEISQ